MKTSIVKMAAVAAVMALAAVLWVGCGGDDNPSGGGNGGGDNNGGNNGGGGSSESVKIGTQTWMKKNLNIEAGNSWCYDNDPANCETYGRLYDWATAKTVCPSGYHLPTSEEWNTLVTTAGGSDEAKEKLKSKSGWNNYNGKSGNGTDTFGFSALPSGDYSDGFNHVGDRGTWWTDTEPNNNNYAYFYGIYNEIGYVYTSMDAKRVGYAVRCVK